MLITFNFKDIKLLSLQFLILLINDFLIYIIFFIWYLLYQLNIVISPNPLFAYILTLFYNLLILYFMIYKNISIDKIILGFILINLLQNGSNLLYDYLLSSKNRFNKYLYDFNNIINLHLNINSSK